MRDLYYRLGIESKASDQKIRDAVSCCDNSKLREDADAVLLVPSRKRNYDQVHVTISDIGILRAHLGLNHSDNWQSPESDDFTTRPFHGISLYDELLQKVNRLNKNAKKESAINSIKRLFDGLFRLVYVSVGIMFVIWIFSFSEDTSNPSPNRSRPHSETLRPEFNETALPLPASGTTRRHIGTGGVAPLEIKTSSGLNYLVKLEDVSTGVNILDVFVRGGATVNLEVPLGTYRLKYASGKTWYGYEHYFGPPTGYNKADSNFRFYNDGSRVSGYTVTLYQVQNGNLSTSRLTPGEF